MKKTCLILFLVIGLLVLFSCNVKHNPTPFLLKVEATPTPTPSVILRSPTKTPTKTPSKTPVYVPPTPTPSETPEPDPTPTLTPV